MKKTKILVSGAGMDLLENFVEFPCAVCLIGVGANSILCSVCNLWANKKCRWLSLGVNLENFSNPHLKTYSSYYQRESFFSACVRSAILHGGETWVPNVLDLQMLREMILHLRYQTLVVVVDLEKPGLSVLFMIFAFLTFAF